MVVRQGYEDLSDADVARLGAQRKYLFGTACGHLTALARDLKAKSAAVELEQPA